MRILYLPEEYLYWKMKQLPTVASKVIGHVSTSEAARRDYIQKPQ